MIFLGIGFLVLFAIVLVSVYSAPTDEREKGWTDEHTAIYSELRSTFPDYSYSTIRAMTLDAMRGSHSLTAVLARVRNSR